jgi:hypothetical protein
VVRLPVDHTGREDLVRSRRGLGHGDADLRRDQRSRTTDYGGTGTGRNRYHAGREAAYVLCTGDGGPQQTGAVMLIVTAADTARMVAAIAGAGFGQMVLAP